MADSWIVTPPTPIIHEEEMPDYEDDDLQSPVESKVEEAWGNTVGRGFWLVAWPSGNANSWRKLSFSSC